MDALKPLYVGDGVEITRSPLFPIPAQAYQNDVLILQFVSYPLDDEPPGSGVAFAALVVNNDGLVYTADIEHLRVDPEWIKAWRTPMPFAMGGTK